MKPKITSLHLFLLNHFILTLIILGVLGVYGTYLFNVEQRALKEKIDPMLGREADRLSLDLQYIESNVLKLKSLVEMFDFMPARTRVENISRYASESLAPYPIQYNAFVALGPRLSQKYFHRNSFVLTVHRNQALEGGPKYLDAKTFITEQFPAAGYDNDPNMQWWAMNKHKPGLNFSDFYFDKGYMEKVMFTSAMGIFAQGELEAVVGIDTLAGEIAQRLGDFHLGETGGLLLVDAGGYPVLPLLAKDLPMLDFRYVKPFNENQFKSLPQTGTQKFEIKGENINEFTGADGEVYIALPKPIKFRGQSGYLLAYQKKSEAYAGLYGRLLFLSLAIFMGYILVSVALFITGRHVINRDKKAFEELRKSKDAAEAATKAKSIFLSTMSHEIRTPLNAMLGTADLLKETSLSVEQQEYVRALMSAGESLLGILNDVLDFSKIEAGKMSLERVEFLLSDLVRDIEILIMPTIYRKGLRFSVNCPGLDGKFVGDVLRLKQVLLNLLGNAVKFTDQGSVELTIYHEPQNESGLRRIYFEVTDTGIGIAKENYEKIFNEFGQGDSSVTRRFGGSGLGLSISKKIVELMSGKMFFKSIQNAGSTFGFYVDLDMKATSEWKSPVGSLENVQLQACPRESETVESRDVSGSVRKILLVDDMDENHVLLKAYIKRMENIEIESAFSGVECLEKFLQKSYDLILMDVQMPRMSGLDTIKKLREIEGQHGMSRVPIVVVSANSFVEDREKSLAIGADEHCSKPIRKQDLMCIIARYCGQDVQK